MCEDLIRWPGGGRLEARGGVTSPGGDLRAGSTRSRLTVRARLLVDWGVGSRDHTGSVAVCLRLLFFLSTTAMNGER